MDLYILTERDPVVPSLLTLPANKTSLSYYNCHNSKLLNSVIKKPPNTTIELILHCSYQVLKQENVRKNEYVLHSLLLKHLGKPNDEYKALDVAF